MACRVFDTFSPNLHQHAIWDRDERVTFWGQKVTMEYNMLMLETALIAFTAPLGGCIQYSVAGTFVPKNFCSLELSLSEHY